LCQFLIFFIALDGDAQGGHAEKRLRAEFEVKGAPIDSPPFASSVAIVPSHLLDG
jgi:hypothetical protein